MSMDFNVEHGSIEIFQSIPDEFKSLRIPGAHQQLIRTDFLKLLVRAFPGIGYNCYLANYLVHENGGMGAKENKPLLELCYSMEGQLTGKMDGVDNAELAPGTFNIRYTPHVETKAKFKKGQNTTTFDVHVERIFLERFRLKHRVMGDFLEQADKGEPAQLLQHSPKANWFMRHAINEIISNNFYVEGAHNYCHIYCIGAVSYKNVSLTMTDMEELLPVELFYRAHKSFFVGKKYMDTMNKIKTRIFCVNGSTVNIGRKYRPEFLRRLRIKKDKDSDAIE